MQVARNEIGIRIVSFIRNAGFAKEGEKQFALVPVGDQPHRNIDLISRWSNDRVIQHPVLVSGREAHLNDPAIGVGNPSSFGLPQGLAKTKGPLIPIQRIHKILIDRREWPIDAHAQSTRLDRATMLGCARLHLHLGFFPSLR